MKAFTHIGEACKGFVEAVRETVEKTELIEALIKVRDNYHYKKFGGFPMHKTASEEGMSG